jgi:Asp/Glu/hydantoin racemase
MMVGIASSELTGDTEVFGATATRAPAMIVDTDALAASGAEVADIAHRYEGACDGIIVAAFGDPGLAEIRARSAVPAVGIGEAAMWAAAKGNRRFGVATTTPALVETIAQLAAKLGLGSRFTGTRLTSGDPVALIADPQALLAGLVAAVRACIDEDGAEAVIIGGGPLAQAAHELQPLFGVPIIRPIAAAVARITAAMGS